MSTEIEGYSFNYVDRSAKRYFNELYGDSIIEDRDDMYLLHHGIFISGSLLVIMFSISLYISHISNTPVSVDRIAIPFIATGSLLATGVASGSRLSSRKKPDLKAIDIETIRGTGFWLVFIGFLLQLIWPATDIDLISTIISVIPISHLHTGIILLAILCIVVLTEVYMLWKWTEDTYTFPEEYIEKSRRFVIQVQEKLEEGMDFVFGDKNNSEANDSGSNDRSSDSEEKTDGVSNSEEERKSEEKKQ